MKQSLIYFLALLLSLSLLSCRSGAEKSSSVPVNSSQTSKAPSIEQSTSPPPSASSQSQDEWTYASELFIEGESLTLNGYDILKIKRLDSSSTSDQPFEVSFAVVRKQDKSVVTLDGAPATPVHGIDFALFALMGTQNKQIIVSQTEPRGGSHWILDLSSGCRVIFESRKYEVGREDIGFRDLDNDGVYELSMPVTAFYLEFDQLSMAETPLPEVIFKYNPKAGKYEPANHLFQNFLLEGIEKLTTASNNSYPGAYLASRLAPLLDYLYAGQEQKGWSVFRQHYRPPASLNLPSEAIVESQVRKILQRCPAYKMIRQAALKR